ncbi:alpha/beta fold hydrolase [Williamsia serinedens]|uniref:Alpha/beta hydrolase family n=1 Tax=Williamsia serinedens TaxID=391736 RepID=A0ABT1GVV0_9NOCA|nr:alpha/beta hydrolase [Williamsia serinedens]MCP2159103.1 Alpha/beta hydrolase family [Williamsia serinedens]
MATFHTPPDRVAITASSLVAMPGAGSDGDYARRALGPLAETVGVPLIAVDPGPAGIVATCLDALDEAARHGPVIAAGISIGACVAVHWAATRPGACAAVVAASPPWPPGGAGHSPAAAAARATVAAIEQDGLAAAIAAMRASSPGWLGDELGRSWTALGDLLAPHLREAASASVPTAADMSRSADLGVATAVVAVDGDAVHPTEVAIGWAEMLGVAPRVIDFDTWAEDPGSIGRAAADALRDLRPPTR